MNCLNLHLSFMNRKKRNCVPWAIDTKELKKNYFFLFSRKITFTHFIVYSLFGHIYVHQFHHRPPKKKQNKNAEIKRIMNEKF